MLSLLPMLALAAGLDADGHAVPAADGQGAAGLVPLAPRQEAGAGAATLRADAVGGALVRTEPEGTDTMVGSATYLRAQVAHRWLPWLGTTATLPFRVQATSDAGAGGPALGDAAATAWLGRTDLSVGLGASLPTGSTERFAGAGRVVPHLQLAGHRRFGAIDVAASVRGAHEGAVEPAAGRGGAVLGGALGAALVDPAGRIGLSTRATTPLSTDIAARRGRLLEFAADATWFADERLALGAVVAHAPLGGAGAPAWRGSVGVSYRWGPEPEPEPEPEPVLRTFRVLDPDGKPVVGARFLLDGDEERFSGPDGTLALATGRTGTVSAHGLGEVPLDGADTLVLPWVSVPLTVRVRTVDGSAANPWIRIQDEGGTTLNGVSGRPVELLPGTWTVEVGATGYGTQTRTLPIAPRSVADHELEVSLLPSAGDAQLVLVLTDSLGRGVEGAEVRVDDLSIGTSSAGGVRIDGLAVGDVEVAAARRRYRPQTATVDLAEGVGQAALELAYAPGTVRVTAEGQGGPITDALLFVDGAESLPPLTLDHRGERLIDLENGRWTLTLSSPRHGLQERLVVVGPDSPAPIDVPFALFVQDAEPGPVSLWVDVIDPDGRPVADTTVTLDGLPIGATATGGSLRVEGLPEGTMSVDVAGLGLQPTQREIVLRSGLEVLTVPVRWDPGVVQVRARDAQGPVDAMVDFASSSGAYEAGPLGPDGHERYLDVPLGEWEVVASHSSGLQSAWVRARDDGRSGRVDLHLGAPSGPGSMELSVVDPSGHPLSDVELWLDGFPMGRSDAGALKVVGLPMGQQTYELRHPHHPVLRQPLTPTEGTPEPVEVELLWGTGLVDVAIQGSAEGALLFASGPTTMPPIAITAQQEPQRIQLAPGAWDLVLSASSGLANAHVELPDTPAPPMPVSMVVGGVDGALLHVVDRARRPLAGVPVFVDGQRVGQTGDAGTLVVPVAAIGSSVEVRDPRFDAREPVTLVPADEHWIEIDALARPFEIRVEQDGEPVRAEIAFLGSTRRPTTSVQGSGTASLPPGPWAIVVTPPEGLAPQRIDVVIPETGPVPPVVVELQAAGVEKTSEGLALIDVHFGLDQDVADPVYVALLEEVAAHVLGDPSILRLEVQGHTDRTGTLEYNYDLSRRRAESIVEALVSLGVPRERLEARGYGPSRPIADEATQEGRGLNRRVDFRTIRRGGQETREGR